MLVRVRLHRSISPWRRLWRILLTSRHFPGFKASPCPGRMISPFMGFHSAFTKKVQFNCRTGRGRYGGAQSKLIWKLPRKAFSPYLKLKTYWSLKSKMFRLASPLWGFVLLVKVLTAKRPGLEAVTNSSLSGRCNGWDSTQRKDVSEKPQFRYHDTGNTENRLCCFGLLFFFKCAFQCTPKTVHQHLSTGKRHPQGSTVHWAQRGAVAGF